MRRLVGTFYHQTCWLATIFWSWILQCQAEPAHLEQAWYVMIVFFGIQAAHSLDVHVGEAGEAATFGECPTIVQAKSVWKSSEMWWARFVVMGCLVILVTRHAAGLLIHQKAFLRVCRSPRRHPNEGARSGLRARLNQWLQDVFFRPSTVSVVSDQSLYRWAAYDRLLVAFANFKGFLRIPKQEERGREQVTSWRFWFLQVFAKYIESF